MKRGFYISLLVLFLLGLWGCGEPSAADTRIPVSLWEIPGVTVHNNGQYVEPGEDAVFLLTADSGCSLAGTDYDGDYRMNIENGQITLTLENVQYPTHVALTMTEQFVTLSYDPNGGSGQITTMAYDTTNRLRPNTSIGTNLFTREGHTLESWNTLPDGSGERIGLGSRVTVTGESMTLYAQWAKWSDPADFDWTVEENIVTITGYRGGDAAVVIPAKIEGKPVTRIAEGAFENGTMSAVILPETLAVVEEGAFRNCYLETLTLFDNIETIGDSSFAECGGMKTLRINAKEKPYGVLYRRESCYADKVDLLIQAQGEKKIVFYGGCSMWYNLDSASLTPLLDQGYRVVNMGINGLADSEVQMQIMEHYLEAGDILFHTPELSSSQQMMIAKFMDTENADKLWCGLEYNYDLFSLVDLRGASGVLDGFCDYLGRKKEETEYTAVYTKDGNRYCDEYGSASFYRDQTKDSLADEVHMDPSFITDKGMARLKEFYDRYQERGVRIYISYACFNMDEVVEEQRDSVGMVDGRFRAAVKKLEGPVLISNIDDFLYHREDFYDTNYHLLSGPAKENTRIWLRDLQAQMEKDGLWK